MPLTSRSINRVDYLRMRLHLPEHFLLLQIENAQLPFQIPKGKALMRRGRCGKGARFDASIVLNGRNHLEFSLGKLGDLDESSRTGTLSADHEFAAIGDPLDIVRSVVGGLYEMLDQLRRVGCLHMLQKLFKKRGEHQVYGKSPSNLAWNFQGEK